MSKQTHRFFGSLHIEEPSICLLNDDLHLYLQLRPHLGDLEARFQNGECQGRPDVCPEWYVAKTRQNCDSDQCRGRAVIFIPQDDSTKFISYNSLKMRSWRAIRKHNLAKLSLDYVVVGAGASRET